MKKHIVLIIILVLSFLLFGIIIRIPKNYVLKYKVNNTDITEEFNTKKGVYYLTFKTDNEVFKYSLKQKYSRKRSLITSVSIDDKCISFVSSVIKNNTICINDDEYETSYINKDIEISNKKIYKNLELYSLSDRKYFVWNYGSFYSINNDEASEIKLFDNDLYELNLVTKLKNYLVIADYNQKYSFDTFYLINSKNNKVKEVKLDTKIFLNSYILGTFKNSVYLYDLEKEIEYKVNPFKSIIEKNKYEIWNGDSWEETTINRLNKKEYYFGENKTSFYYEIIDGELYYRTDNNRIKISNLEVSRIIDQSDEQVFFISGDGLYYNDLYNGTTLVMKNSEWQFNNKNIYIF